MINTERLVIRPFLLTDAEDVFEWRSDREVNKYMPYPCDESVAEVRQRIEEWIADNDKYAIVLKETGKVIGDITLEWSAEDNAHEIGYNINRSFWRNGYATEAVRGMLDWARNERGIRDITAFYAKDNGASSRVLEKCGFVQEHTGQYSRFDGSETFEAVYVRLHIE